MFDPIQTLQDFIRCPSVSTDPAFAEGMAEARNYVSKLLQQMDFTVDIVATALHPVILAHRGGNAEWPHVIIYGHYDVQPADPYDLWTTPPFDPAIRDGHIYGRGACDNKGPLLAHIAAVAQLLEEQPDLPLQITFLIEGEEEMGSPSFRAFLQANKDRLTGDFIYFSDTPCPSAEQLSITTALRGLTGFEIELMGPSSDLHSGLHGGAVYNPIQALIELGASLHNADGTVNIPGFYDDVVPPQDWEREQLAQYPLTTEAYQTAIGVPSLHNPPGYNAQEAIRFLPTLEFNGITGGYQGEGTKTIIPAKASAKVTIRLVANQKEDEIRRLAMKTVRERCPAGVRLTMQPIEGGDPYLVIPPNRPNTLQHQPERLARGFRAVERAVKKHCGQSPLYLREGGSVPIIAQLKAITGLDSIMLGLVTLDCGMHAPDEFFQLSVYEKAIKTSKDALAEMAGIS